MNPLRKPNQIRSSSGFGPSLSLAGAGLRAQVLTGGRTILTAIPSRVRGGVSHPFKLSSLTEGETVYVKVHLGLVDNVVPKIGEVFLSRVPTPKIEVSGDSGQLWLKCTLDADGTITDVIVETGPSMPTDTSSAAYRLLGFFTFSDGQVTGLASALNANQAHMRCAGVSRWGRA